jgi:hypothetical protein
MHTDNIFCKHVFHYKIMKLIHSYCKDIRKVAALLSMQCSTARQRKFAR